MAQQNLNVGAAINDGTGDVLRSAFIKVQNNFSDLYTNYVSNTNLVANLALYQTLSGLQANIAPMSVNTASYIGSLPAANVVSNAQLIANLSNYVASNTLAGLTLQNTANNTNYVGAIPASNVVSTTTLASNLAAYLTLTGVAANVLQVTANNSNYFNSQNAAYYTNASNHQTGTLPWAQAPTGTVNTSAAFTFANTITFSSNIVANRISANGGLGNNQLLAANSTGGLYWYTLSAFDTTAQYTFTNAISFSSNVNFTGTISAAGANTLSQLLTDTSVITWNVAQGQIAKVTLGGNRQMANPTNMKVGTYILYVYQDGTGSRTLTWGTAFKWTAGVAPVLSTANGALDMFTFASDGTNLYGSYMPNLK